MYGERATRTESGWTQEPHGEVGRVPEQAKAQRHAATRGDRGSVPPQPRSRVHRRAFVTRPEEEPPRRVRDGVSDAAPLGGQRARDGATILRRTDALRGHWRAPQPP